jgi:hypothetical protein
LAVFSTGATTGIVIVLSFWFCFLEDPESVCDAGLLGAGEADMVAMTRYCEVLYMNLSFVSDDWIAKERRNDDFSQWDEGHEIN